MNNSQIEEIFKSTKYSPRPYQVRIINRTLKELKTFNSILINSPTGSGKTVVALILGKILQETEGFKIGWVSHRRNLLKQVTDENNAYGVSLKFDTISMFDKDFNGSYDLIFHDEAHHDATASMQHIFNTCKPRKIIGLSALMSREDKLKLCYSKIINDMGIGSLIREGYLAQYNHWTIPDWKIPSVVEFYLKERDKWGKTVMYFHRLSDCHDASRLLTDKNIRNTVISGDSYSQEKIDDFVDNKYNVAINCLKLTEGFNLPDLKSVFLKPSCKSVTIQMAGRAFRPFKNTIKNVVQCEKTPYVFTKTATAVNTYTWNKDKEIWLGLKPNINTEIAENNSLQAIAKLETKLPKCVSDKLKKTTRRFRIRL